MSAVFIVPTFFVVDVVVTGAAVVVGGTYVSSTRNKTNLSREITQELYNFYIQIRFYIQSSIKIFKVFLHCALRPGYLGTGHDFLLLHIYLDEVLLRNSNTYL